MRTECGVSANSREIVSVGYGRSYPVTSNQDHNGEDGADGMVTAVSVA